MQRPSAITHKPPKTKTSVSQGAAVAVSRAISSTVSTRGSTTRAMPKRSR